MKKNRWTSLLAALIGTSLLLLAVAQEVSAAERDKIRIKNATDRDIKVAVEQEPASDFGFPSGSGSYYTVKAWQYDTWPRSQAAKSHYLYWIEDQGVTHKYRTSSTADKSYLGNGRVFDGLYNQGQAVVEEPPQQNPCAAPIVENEYYYLVSKVSGKVLTNLPGVIGLNQYPMKSDGAGQLFRFNAAGGGYYFINAKHREEQVFCVSSSDYAEISMNTKFAAGKEQPYRWQWYFEDAGGGHYYLKNRHSHKVMEVYAAKKADGTKVNINRRTGGDLQQWRFVKPSAVSNTIVTPGTNYFITSKFSDKVLSVKGGSKDPNAPIVQWSQVGAESQKFSFVPQGDGYYYIVAKHSGHVIAAQGTENGIGVVQHPKEGIPDAVLERFRWKPEPAGFELYRLISKASGRALVINQASVADGGQTVLFDKNDQDQQVWRIESAAAAASNTVVEGKDYFILSKSNNKPLAVNGNSQEQGAGIIMWDKEDAPHFKFSFVPAGGGYYHIIAQHSGQALAAQGTGNDAGVVQYPTQGLNEATLDRFRWKIEPGTDGHAALTAKAGGRALTIGAGADATGKGAQLTLYDNYRAPHQVWRFEAAGGTALPVAGRDYMILSKLNNKLVAVPGSSQDKNTVYIMWNKEDGANSKFNFVPAGGGYYYIIVKHSGQAMHAHAQGNDALVSQYPSQGLDEATLDLFRWKIESVSDGHFSLIVKAGGRVLTIGPGGDASGNGAQMTLYDNYRVPHQLWRFE
jgi:hypothetical protein